MLSNVRLGKKLPPPTGTVRPIARCSGLVSQPASAGRRWGLLFDFAVSFFRSQPFPSALTIACPPLRTPALARPLQLRLLRLRKTKTAIVFSCAMASG